MADEKAKQDNPGLSNVRLYFNPDAFVGRVFANWVSICVIVAIFYLPGKAYDFITNLSTTSFAVLVGIVIGSFLQSKIRLYDVISKTAKDHVIPEPTLYPSASLHPQYSAAALNDMIEAVWPKISRLIKKRIPKTAIPIKKSSYSILAQDVDLATITCRVMDMKVLRPHHLEKSHILIKCVGIIKGEPNTSIQLISDNPLYMNISANVNMIDVRANVYIKASLEYNTLQVYFDDDLSADVNMDADLTQLKVPMAGESFLAESLINYLINFDEQNPIVIDTSSNKGDGDDEKHGEDSDDETAASREANEQHKRGAPLGVLKITVVSAKNLKKGDVFGSSDPYVKLKHQGKKFKTKWIKKTLNPTWNETFDCVVCSEQESLKFEVKDKDVGSTDDLLGTLVLQAGRFMDVSTPQTKSFPLIKQGTLMLTTNWNPLDEGTGGAGPKPVSTDVKVDAKESETEPKKQEEEVKEIEEESEDEPEVPPQATSSYLCPELVQEAWKKHRGNAKGPQEAMIDKAIAKSDANSDGVLNRSEIRRLATAFVVKMNPGKNAVREDEVFDLLNADNNESIGRTEVKTAFKAMWLMQKNGVALDEMLRKRPALSKQTSTTI